MSWRVLNQVFSTAFFYFAWGFCLYEVSAQSYYSFFLIAAFIIYYLYMSSCRVADYFLLASVVLMGPFSDMLYARFGLLQYHGELRMSSWLPPLWVFFLWALFAANIQLFTWLNHRWIPAMILGALGGPLSYLSVTELGGATLLKPWPLTLLVIGGIWLMFFPFFLWLNAFLRKSFQT